MTRKPALMTIAHVWFAVAWLEPDVWWSVAALAIGVYVCCVAARERG